MQFAVKDANLGTLTRNFNKFPKVNTIQPISTDFILAYEQDSSSLCLINYQDAGAQVVKLKHSV